MPGQTAPLCELHYAAPEMTNGLFGRWFKMVVSQHAPNPISKADIGQRTASSASAQSIGGINRWQSSQRFSLVLA